MLEVRLIIYDIIGKEVATLINERLQPGTYEVTWDASIFASGAYFCRLSWGEYSGIKKIVLVK
jgi:hypothetical protein